MRAAHYEETVGQARGRGTGRRYGWFTIVLLIGCTALAACGSTDAASRSREQAAQASERLAPGRSLDLNDPAVRRQFVCSFAPGSFGISPQLARLHGTDESPCADAEEPARLVPAFVNRMDRMECGAKTARCE
jgi:hypothetical protein